MAQHHTDHDLQAAPEVDRVNVEPAILLGLSSTEAIWTIAIAFAIWTPVAAVLAVLKGSFPLFILLDTTLPMATVWLSAKKMATVKRNRPDLYYAHAMRKWAARTGIRKSRYITHVGEWDVGRSFPPAPPAKPKYGLIRR